MTHPVPAVSISADPGTILAGESSTLSWTSTYADTCVIEPYIGPVELSGSGWVQPSETTTYTITATGPGGTASDSVIVTVTPQITLTITSPADNDTITRPDVMVHGTVTNAVGNETGVVVNGILAMVYGDQFVANHVPLQEGENTITATATDTQGNTAEASVTVTLQPENNYIKITADQQSGVSPLEVTLSIEGSFDFTESSLSCTGPGNVEFLESSAYEYRVLMPETSIYYFTAEVTDPENNVHTDTVAIEVIDQAQLDQLLKGKWSGMKTALANQDIENALNYFAENTKNLYNEIYTVIYDNLPQIAQDMQDIELIYAEDNLAKYRIRKNELYNGEMLTITYYIYFEKDEKGLWKIYRY